MYHLRCCWRYRVKLTEYIWDRELYVPASIICFSTYSDNICKWWQMWRFCQKWNTNYTVKRCILPLLSLSFPLIIQTGLKSFICCRKQEIGTSYCSRLITQNTTDWFYSRECQRMFLSVSVNNLKKPILKPWTVCAAWSHLLRSVCLGHGGLPMSEAPQSSVASFHEVMCHVWIVQHRQLFVLCAHAHSHIAPLLLLEVGGSRGTWLPRRHGESMQTPHQESHKGLFCSNPWFKRELHTSSVGAVKNTWPLTEAAHDLRWLKIYSRKDSKLYAATDIHLFNITGRLKHTHTNKHSCRRAGGTVEEEDQIWPTSIYAWNKWTQPSSWFGDDI